MIKIYFYELRRAVCNKFYLGLLILCLCYGWLTLTSSIIQGVAHTAPFSPWSFGFYLAQQAPLMSLAFLVLQEKLVSPNAKAIRTLTDATPIDVRIYLLLQCAAIGTAWLLLAGCVTALGMRFLLQLFTQAVNLSALVLPALTVLIPLLIFLMGIGLFAGVIHPVALVLIAPLLIVLGMVPFPLDLFGTDFFSTYPLALAGVDQVFTLPLDMILGRAIYMFLGFLFFALACVTHKYKVKRSEICNSLAHFTRLLHLDKGRQK